MKILVTGSKSGLGAAIADSLRRDWETVMDFDISMGEAFDVTNVTSGNLRALLGGPLEIDVLINCAGVNQNEWFEDVTYERFQRVMDVNAWGQINMTQAALPWLKNSDIKLVINIVSNAAHMPMTSSLAYNCSKAAALMATKQMAHELTPKYGITVMSVSPNKLAGTGMSKQIDAEVVRVRGWTPEFAEEYQKRGLMKGLETEPEAVAEFITNLIVTGQYKFLSGCDMPYGK